MGDIPSKDTAYWEMRQFRGHLESLGRTFYAEASARFGPPLEGWQRSFEIGFRQGAPITDVSARPKVKILLSQGVADSKDLQNAMFELSHETVHLLAPGRWPASVLEEGLAVTFSIEVPSYEDASGKRIGRWAETDPSHYARAYRYVRSVLRNAPLDGIAKLRATQPDFGLITCENLKQFLAVDAVTAEVLMQGCVEGVALSC